MIYYLGGRTMRIGLEKVKGYNYNPTLAAKLLVEAGFPNGKGMPEIKLSTSTTYKDLIEFIQGELNNIGIKAKVDVSPSASLRDLMSKNEVIDNAMVSFKPATVRSITDVIVYPADLTNRIN